MPDLYRTTELLKVAAEPTRLLILLLLTEGEGERHVGALITRLVQTPP